METSIIFCNDYFGWWIGILSYVPNELNNMTLLYIIRAYSGFCLKIEHYVSSSHSHFASTLQFVSMLITMNPLHMSSSYPFLEFVSCREIFLCMRWGPFLSSLQGHDDGVSLQFSLSFDGKTAHIRSLTFPISEESIAISTKLPRLGDRWFKTISCHVKPMTMFSNKSIRMFLGLRVIRRVGLGMSCLTLWLSSLG
jgi:hypothetical protein